MTPGTLERIGSSGPDFALNTTFRDCSYTFESVVRLCQHYLSQVEGISERNPKPILRKLAASGLLSDDEGRRALVMVDDRNLMDHTYIEAVADRV